MPVALSRGERYRHVRAAEVALGCDRATAERIGFITWLVEMRWLSDDPSLPPVRVRSARPHGLEAWYEGPGRLIEISTVDGLPGRERHPAPVVWGNLRAWT